MYGEYPVKIDDKGRISIPTRLRAGLETNPVMWRGLDGQIMVHPHEAWEKAVQNLENQPQDDPVLAVRRLLFAGAEVEIDPQGRVVVPPTLRKHADLAGEVVVAGMGDHVEIWNEQRWEAAHREAFADRTGIKNRLASLNIKIL